MRDTNEAVVLFVKWINSFPPNNMTPLRFRAWDKKRKQLGEVSFLANQELDKVRYWFEDIEYDGYIPTIIIMQSTGLKDKNGKEIFEGDILKLETKNRKDHPLHIVEWLDTKCKFLTRRNGEEHTERKYTSLPKPHDTGTWEIIGNIYENEDLIPSP